MYDGKNNTRFIPRQKCTGKKTIIFIEINSDSR
jgi:hypothetical protein